MTTQQLRLLGENARQLPLVPEPEPLPVDMSDFECAWCLRTGCEGGPECKYVSPYDTQKEQ
jgi:hypothetical protein